MKKPLPHLPSQFAMIDLETLAVHMNAAVLQIGVAAWQFDGEGAEIEDSPFRVFNEYLPLQPQIDLGRIIQAGTIKFHIDLGFNCLVRSITSDNGLVETLHTFAGFFDDLEDYAVISRGAAFDFPIIESLMTLVGVKVPWKYNQVWDHRTVMNLVGDPGIARPTHFVNHDGYWDARFQLRQLIAIFEKMGGESEDSPPIHGTTTAKLNLNPQRAFPLK